MVSTVQWVLRALLLAHRFLQSGVSGLQSEVMDASMLLVRNYDLTWGEAVTIQGVLVCATLAAWFGFAKTRRFSEPRRDDALPRE